MTTYISAGTTTSTALKVIPDTSGNLAFQTQAGANTITVPNVTGTLLTNKTAGTVLQVVQTIVTTSSTASVTSPTYVDIGLSANITPTSSTSKILVMGNIEIGWSSAAGGWIQLVRNSTAIGNGTGGSYANFMSGIQISGVTPSNNFWVLPFQYLDSPATTSSTTYKLQASLDANGTVALNRRQGDTAFGGSSVITLMEIAA